MQQHRSRDTDLKATRQSDGRVAIIFSRFIATASQPIERERTVIFATTAPRRWNSRPSEDGNGLQGCAAVGVAEA